MCNLFRGSNSKIFSFASLLNGGQQFKEKNLLLTFSGEAIHIFIFASLLSGGQLFKGKNLLLEEQILSFKSRPLLEWFFT